MRGTDKDVEELRRMFEVELPAAVRARDVEAYASHFAEEAVWCPPDVAEGHNPAEIAKGFAGLIANVNVDPVFTTHDIVVKGKDAHLFGRGLLTIYPLDGGPSSVDHSRELRIFRKEQGVWKITYMMWNSDPTKPAPGSKPARGSGKSSGKSDGKSARKTPAGR